MRLRPFLTLGIPLASAALFARLGVWQLARLSERRSFNRTLAARLEAAPVAMRSLGSDTSLGHYRRVSASGVFLYDREIVYAGRAHDGSPGVDLLTPLALSGTDTVVLVNRGWAYSPDAQTLEPARWREQDSATVFGYAETFGGRRRAGGTGRPAATGRPQTLTVHELEHGTIEAAVGHPVARYVLVQTSDSAPRPGVVPARLNFPALGEGSHRGYAVQWFSFALIATVGGVVLLRKQRAEGAVHHDWPPRPADTA